MAFALGGQFVPGANLEWSHAMILFLIRAVPSEHPRQKDSEWNQVLAEQSIQLCSALQHTRLFSTTEMFCSSSVSCKRLCQMEIEASRSFKEYPVKSTVGWSNGVFKGQESLVLQSESKKAA